MARGGGEDLASQRALVHVVWRGIDTDEYLGARLRQFRDRIALVEAALPVLLVIPGVLADREGQTVSIESGEGWRLAGEEVAGFVEHDVGRQQHFRVPADCLATLDARTPDRGA